MWSHLVASLNFIRYLRAPMSGRDFFGKFVTVLACSCSPGEASQTGGSTSAQGSTACVNDSATEVTTTLEVTTTIGNETEEPAGGDLCPGDSIVRGCCCFDEDEPSENIGVVCNVTFPCPTIELFCKDYSSDTCLPSCAQAVDCALDVLIAGAPAGIRWGYDVLGGFEGADVTLYLSGDGLGYVRERRWLDSAEYFNPIDGVQVKDAAFFKACKEYASVSERFSCIENAVASPDPKVVSECFIDGFYFPR